MARAHQRATNPDRPVQDTGSGSILWCPPLRPAARGFTVVIPEKFDRIAVRNRRGGRPQGLCTETDADRDRDVVECRLALAEQGRALANRDDSLALTHRAAIVLAACATWTQMDET